MTPGDFFLDSNRRIFLRMAELTKRSQPIDTVTLCDELTQHEELETVGGAVYLSSLTDGQPRFSNIEHYVKIVRDKAMLRRAIYAAQNIITEAQREPENIGEFLRRAKENLPIPLEKGGGGPVPVCAARFTLKKRAP